MQLVYQYDEMTHDEAWDILQGYLSEYPGVLKVITDEVADPSRDPKDICHNVCHVVTALERSEANGRVTAHTAEGDWTNGSPKSVLKRLLEPALEGI